MWAILQRTDQCDHRTGYCRGVGFSRCQAAPILRKPSHQDGDLVYGFRIVGDPEDGTIEHVGDLGLFTHGTFLLLSWYVIDLDRGVLTAEVSGGDRIDLFTLGETTDDGVTLELTAGAADALNSTFGFDAFAEGLVFGYGKPMPE